MKFSAFVFLGRSGGRASLAFSLSLALPHSLCTAARSSLSGIESNTFIKNKRKLNMNN